MAFEVDAPPMNDDSIDETTNVAIPTTTTTVVVEEQVDNNEDEHQETPSRRSTIFNAFSDESIASFDRRAVAGTLFFDHFSDRSLLKTQLSSTNDASVDDEPAPASLTATRSTTNKMTNIIHSFVVVGGGVALRLARDLGLTSLLLLRCAALLLLLLRRVLLLFARQLDRRCRCH